MIRLCTIILRQSTKEHYLSGGCIASRGDEHSRAQVRGFANHPWYSSSRSPYYTDSAAVFVAVFASAVAVIENLMFPVLSEQFTGVFCKV